MTDLRKHIEDAAEAIISCRSCGAEPGRKCKTKRGRILPKPHGRRLTDAVANGIS